MEDAAGVTADESKRRVCTGDGADVLRRRQAGRHSRRDYRNLKNGPDLRDEQAGSAPGASESSKMDFSRPDAAGAERTDITFLWRDQRGDAPAPAARHTVFPAGGDEVTGRHAIQNGKILT